MKIAPLHVPAFRVAVTLAAFASGITACAGASAPTPPGTSSPVAAAADASAAPTSSPPTGFAPPDVARFVQDWQVACVGGPEGAKTHNECQIETLTRLGDDQFFFAGGYFGSARFGSHLLKHGPMRSAFMGVVDRTGDVKWVKALGASWHNEINSSIALDAHHVMISGFHGWSFDPSLPHRRVRPVVIKGVAQDMGYKAEERFVGVVSDEGKIEWLKNSLDLVGGSWNEDVGSPECELESDGAGGGVCRLEWASSVYRVHVDAEGTSEIVNTAPVAKEPPRLIPSAPPNRVLSSLIDRSPTPTEKWRVIEDTARLTRFDEASMIANETNDVHYVLWHAGAKGTWNATIGDGPSRGNSALFVAGDGVAWVTAPRVRSIPGHPAFSEVALHRIEPDGRIAWSTPVWGLGLPAANGNRVDAAIKGRNAEGVLDLEADYFADIAVANVPLPPPIGARARIAHVGVDSATGGIKRLEWSESSSGCLRDFTMDTDHKIEISETERVVGGFADGDWDTARCGESHGEASVIARFVRAGGGR